MIHQLAVWLSMFAHMNDGLAQPQIPCVVPEVRVARLDSLVAVVEAGDKPSDEPGLSTSTSACIPGKACIAGTDAPTSTIPADLLAAMTLVEGDKSLLTASNAAVVTATDALRTANTNQANATKTFAKDKADLQILINKYYPPDPTPIPPSPIPPQPIPPGPEPPLPVPTPVDSVSLTFITAPPTINCPACKNVEAESLPMLQQQLGSKFTRIVDSAAANKAGFPTIGTADGGGYVPRWVLIRNGKVEKRVGYMSTAALQNWIAGK